MEPRWYVLKVNPEPWAVGEAGVGKKGGKFFARVSPSAGLVAYQNAVREELSGVEKLPNGEYKLTFFLWRQQSQYISASDKRVTKHVADATNMQKGLEDALQGILFDNDRNVQDIRTVIIGQSPEVEPLVIIKAEMLNEFDFRSVPDSVWKIVDSKPEAEQSEFDYEEAEDIF